MATKTLPVEAEVKQLPARPREDRRADWRNYVKPLASLRLTVVLFAMSIFIVLVGTLAQAEKDMWEVMDIYFRSIVAWIELKVFFPPAWFPQGTPLPAWLAGAVIPFPGGFSIGLALFVNLLAAHMVRFTVQARGTRLLWGLVVTAVGLLLTTLVILSGHNREGLQGEPLLSWGALWSLLKISLGLLWVASAASVVVLKGRVLERTCLGLFSAGLGALLVYLVLQGDRVQLSDSSLRILWQLLQGGLASVVLLIGCALLFKQRGGITLLHAGVGLLMFYEFFVSLYAVEARMTIPEGQTVSFARDIRTTELAVVDTSPEEFDRVTVIPRWLLEGTRQIQDPQLPFQVEMLEYYKNANLRPLKSDDQNPATGGLGTRFFAEEARAGSGADAGGEVDMAAAYVQLTDPKTEQDLGTYLLAVGLAEQDMAEKVEVGGKTYELYLRFKRDYKPYALQLLDVRRDDYPGTNTPKNYSSDLILTDASRDVERPVKIWMNNPLRYAGETFYQSGYQVARDGTEITDLQVVTNTGWMIPYVACMIVTVGLLAQFVSTLLRFLSRSERSAGGGVLAGAVAGGGVPVDGGSLSASPAAGPPGDPASGKNGKKGGPSARKKAPLAAPSLAERQAARKWKFISLGVASAMAMLCLLYVAPKMRVPSVEPQQEFDLYRFGQLPVRYQGRVKPLDTLARNTLQVVSNRREYYTDEQGEKQPAIRWLLDVVADTDDAEKHKVFRIDNLDVLALLGLEPRPGFFRYSVEELRPKAEEFNEQVEKIRQKPTESLDNFERKLMELDRRIRAFTLLQASFRPLPFPAVPTEEEFQANREQATEQLMEIRRMLAAIPEAERILDRMQPPQAVPVLDAENDKQAWAPYGPAMNRAFVQRAIMQQEANQPTVELAGILNAYREGKPAEFNRQVVEYQRLLRDEVPMGFAAERIRFESFFNHFSPYYMSMILYIMAFVIGSVAMVVAVLEVSLKPRNWHWVRPVSWSAFAVLMVALAIHTFALIGRIYISGRPPVTNLYSSAIFIGWFCVVMGAWLELMFRVGLPTVVASVAGFATLLIAFYLTGDGDTVAVLQAVLDTQFWLATHVLTITAGYATTYLAGLFGIVFILITIAVPLIQRVAGVRPHLDPVFMKTLGTIIYGILCFSLFFSFFGTVLGGLWADDSWGRFWGWDPKENGALIIVLWNALILHARWGGMVKERGMAVLAVGGNIVTSWSWFGVNELGIGLHSYGFTEGVLLTLGIFVLSQMAFIGLGMLPQSLWGLRKAEAA